MYAIEKRSNENETIRVSVILPFTITNGYITVRVIFLVTSLIKI